MEYRVIVPGTPPRKNRRHILLGGKFPRMVNSPEFKAFTRALKTAWDEAGHPRVEAGTWRLEVASTWPRVRHLDCDVPLGDVDAPVSCILDALQEAELLDDDARVMQLSATKAQGSDPSVTISLIAL